MTGRCLICGREYTRTSERAVSDAIWFCTHSTVAAPVTQLPGVTFHEQALLAIRSLAETGRDFTIGEAHPFVDVAPLDPAREWPRATNEAKRLGWIQRVDYAQSVVEGTNRSAVAVWRGTYAVTRGAA